MTMEQRLIDLANAVGADVSSLVASRGNLASLSTTAKGNLVAAINELYTLMGSSGATIDDNAGDGATSVVYSADKVVDLIAAAKVEIQNSILGGASAAYDTLLELETLATSNESAGAALATAVNNRVRFDAAQTLTEAQKLQACQNIGVGNFDVDLVAAYTAAKA